MVKKAGQQKPSLIKHDCCRLPCHAKLQIHESSEYSSRRGLSVISFQKPRSSTCNLWNKKANSMLDSGAYPLFIYFNWPKRLEPPLGAAEKDLILRPSAKFGCLEVMSPIIRRSFLSLSLLQKGIGLLEGQAQGLKHVNTASGDTCQAAPAARERIRTLRQEPVFNCAVHSATHATQNHNLGRESVAPRDSVAPNAQTRPAWTGTSPPRNSSTPWHGRDGPTSVFYPKRP